MLLFSVLFLSQDQLYAPLLVNATTLILSTPYHSPQKRSKIAAAERNNQVSLRIYSIKKMRTGQLNQSQHALRKTIKVYLMQLALL